MERFSKKDRDMDFQKGYYYKHIGCRGTGIYKVLLVLILFLLTPAVVQGQEKGKLAVLPFRIESLDPMEHLKSGLQNMLSSSMADKGYMVVSPAMVNEHYIASPPSFETKDIITLGKDLGTDWVIHGAVTQSGEKINLDFKAVGITSVKSPVSVFMVEDGIDNLADAVERAATSIDDQISEMRQVGMIQIKGNRRIDTDAILVMIESKKGDKFDQDQLDRDLRAIYRMGYFADVNMEVEDGPSGKIVTFSVTEKPTIMDISFDGNIDVKDENLTEEIGVKKYSMLNPSEIKQSINRLKEFYREKGYYNVKITEKIEERPNNEVSLTYLLDEGKKTYITKIEFVGNEIFDDDDLEDIMETSEKSFFSWLTSAGILDKKKLEFDLHKITSLYHNRGYIKARTGAPEITYDKEEGITITISIIEGNQYKVNEVHVEGDLIRPESELLSYVAIQKEEAFNREVIHNDIQTLKKVYANAGYAYADIIPIPRENDQANLVDITYKITKNKKVRFERINITGNRITRDKVIRRELKIVEGDFFSEVSMNKSTENLNRLGFFEDLDIKTKEGSSDDLMIVDVDVKERPTGSFSMGLGYSSFESAIMIFQISQNNLFGRGQELKLNCSLGSRTTLFDVKFTEPWILDKPISASINLYNWETEFDEYTKDSKGGSLGIGFPLSDDDYTRGIVQYAYDDADVTDIYPTAALVIQDMAGRNVTSSITLGVTRNSKDKPWNTTRGSVNSISFEYAGGPLGGDSYFNKYVASSAWFFPVWKSTVLMAKGDAGLVDQRSGGRLPIYEKFRLGGIDSVRGYEWGTISPLDPATRDEIGGEKMWLYKLEYRVPLVKDAGITGLVFFDAGNSFDKVGDWKTNARRSVGFGVRWFSPMGPLRLEYGFKLDKKPWEDSSGEFEFTMGGSF